MPSGPLPFRGVPPPVRGLLSTRPPSQPASSSLWPPRLQPTHPPSWNAPGLSQASPDASRECPLLHEAMGPAPPNLTWPRSHGQLHGAGTQCHREGRWWGPCMKERALSAQSPEDTQQSRGRGGPEPGLVRCHTASHTAETARPPSNFVCPQKMSLKPCDSRIPSGWLPTAPHPNLRSHAPHDGELTP